MKRTRPSPPKSPPRKPNKGIRMNEQAIRKIEKLELKIYLKLEELLRDGPRRVDYDEIAEACSCVRGSVHYNVGKLLSDGVIGYKNGMLYLK